MSHVHDNLATGTPGGISTARDGFGCRAAISAGSRPASPAMPLSNAHSAGLCPPVASPHGPTRRLDRKYPVAAGFSKSMRPGNTPTNTPFTHGPVSHRFATLACHAGVAFFLRTHGAPQC